MFCRLYPARFNVLNRSQVVNQTAKKITDKKDSSKKVGDEKTLTREQFRRVDPSNRIKTTRYNVFNFVPITLFI